ncbi:hypothetical protein [Rhodococcus sp. ZPP]|uniref:hypothetical protein n=1 Tax=Rhodococcus sp. ZPP TaxID=2749906 RepID=UPI001AD88ACB|nr:hypothetical protein [Rhodococcus sp. ZPP]
MVSDARLIKKDITIDGVDLKAGDMVALPTMLYGLDDRKNMCLPVAMTRHRTDRSPRSTPPVRTSTLTLTCRGAAAILITGETPPFENVTKAGLRRPFAPPRLEMHA